MDAHLDLIVDAVPIDATDLPGYPAGCSPTRSNIPNSSAW